jgi:aldose 1-epimerase
MEPITLRSGPLGLALAPAVGGAIVRFWSDAPGAPVELLRPTSELALRQGDPGVTASYPLVPWSNRIRDGRFTFGGRTITLAPNRPNERHPLHGHGFLAPWTVLDRAPSTATLEYRHAPDAWPWAYRARQGLRLTPTELELTLALTNEGDAPMPAGLGWHPYIPRTPETTLTARISEIWLTDPEILPVSCVAPSPDRDPRRGLAVDRTALDNVFVGWDGHAVVTWPERGARLRLAASEPLRTLVVYTPPRQPFFCAEPVSHVTDAFNRAAAGHGDTGMLTLAPGESVRATFTLAPEIL